MMDRLFSKHLSPLVATRPDGPKKQKNHDDDRENEAFVEWTRFTIKPKK